jgi:hypothetical protein
MQQCFASEEMRKPELHITSGMKQPGPRHIELDRLQKLMESDELDLSNVIGELDRLSSSPLTLTRDIIYVAGYGDQISLLFGTDPAKNLSKYIKNPQAIRKFSFASAPFRQMTIERCALQAIKRLNLIYGDCLMDIIRLDFVGHSMGARIILVMLNLLTMYPELAAKQFAFNKFISICGAHKGSPVAAFSKFCCWWDNVGLDLIPENIAIYDEAMGVVDVESTYYAVENDKMVPPDFAAPAGRPVIVLNNVSIFSPHTAILSNPVLLYLLLKTLAE